MSNTPQTTELVLNAAQYGLEPTRAEQIEKVFTPMHAVFRELDAEYREILSAKEVTPDLCDKAAQLRKRYVKVRTSAEVAHKEAKANVLIEGRAIDGLKNIITYATTQNEDKLREIEEHFERMERERLEGLVQKRSNDLAAVDADPSLYRLEEMADDVYANLLEISTKAFNEKKAREAKEEEERIAKAKAEQEENERIRKENEELKAAAQEREAKLTKERAEAEAKVRAEKKAAEDKAKKDREAAEEKLRLEREAREKAEAELKAKEDAEKAEKAAAAARERAAKRAPDKKKLTDFAAAIRALQSPQVTSEEGQTILAASWELLNKTASYIENNAAKL